VGVLIWFGPRLGHIRLRNVAIRCEVVRNVPSWECPETSCLWAFLPNPLPEGLFREHPAPPSQGGGAGSHPVGATKEDLLRLREVFLVDL
jgi:hypothetical protein